MTTLPLNARPLPVQPASDEAPGGLRRLVRDLRHDAYLLGDLTLSGQDLVIPRARWKYPAACW